MEQKILVISGKKQSGKSSLANFLCGYELRRKGVLKWFDIADDGRLQVPAHHEDLDGNITTGVGVMDLGRYDEEFIEFSKQFIWPNIKIYNFADRLKQIITILFGIPYEQLSGTDEQKMLPTRIIWKDVRFLLGEAKVAELSIKKPQKDFKVSDSWDLPMTGRDIAQVFGSDVCRRIYNNCWVQACYDDIVHDSYPYVVIADARFPNELTFMKERGAKLIRLGRSPYQDNHSSETALDNFEGYDLVVDNKDMSIRDKNRAVLDYLLSIGWTGSLAEGS